MRLGLQDTAGGRASLPTTHRGIVKLAKAQELERRLFHTATRPPKSWILEVVSLLYTLS